MKTKRHLTLTALVVILAALLAGPAAAQNEYSNNGWYTGLEHHDMAPAAETQYSNNGWYTGLEHADLPPLQAASADDGVAWDDTTLGVGAALGAALLTATVVATRTRGRRVAA